MKQQYFNEILRRRFCTMDKNYISTVQGSGALYSRDLLHYNSFRAQCINQIITIT